MNAVFAARFDPPTLIYFKKIAVKIIPIGLFPASKAAGIPLNPSTGNV